MVSKKSRARSLKVVILIAAVVLPMSLSAQQQPSATSPAAPGSASDIEVEDQELENFAEVLQEVQQVQQSYGEDVQNAISDSSLEEKRFREIHSAAQKQSSDKAEGQTEAETKQYKKLLGKIQKLQQKSNKEMVSVVKGGGFSVKRFNAIATALRSNPELGKRLKKFM